eukprot:6181080-Pleurochrysis_carterae.AAC.6
MEAGRRRRGLHNAVSRGWCFRPWLQVVCPSSRGRSRNTSARVHRARRPTGASSCGSAGRDGSQVKLPVDMHTHNGWQCEARCRKASWLACK